MRRSLVAGVLTGMRFVLLALTFAALAAGGRGPVAAAALPIDRQQAPPVGTQVAPTGAITGVVRSATGQPIVGAAVLLSPAAGHSRQMTDERGRFAFVSLPPGTYRLLVNAFGYVDGQYGQASMFAPTGTIALAHGHWFDRADVTLWRTGGISGRVVDEHGDPVAGTYVRVLAQLHVAGTPRLFAGPAALTDDRGMYRIGRLPPARYLVVVPSVQSTVPADFRWDDGRWSSAGFDGGTIRVLHVIPAEARLHETAANPANLLILGSYAMAPAGIDGSPVAYAITFHPGGSSPASAAAIDLGPAEERGGVDMVLRAVPTVRVSGVASISSSSGAAGPVAGVALRLMPVGLESLGTGSEAATTIVGSDGRFAFLNVPAGNYVIDAGAKTELTFHNRTGASLPLAGGVVNPNSQRGSLPGLPGAGYLSRAATEPNRYFGRLPITVGASDLVVEMPLHASVSLTGRLVFEGKGALASLSFTGGASGGAAPSATLRLDTALVLPPITAEPAAGDTSLGVTETGIIQTTDPSGASFTISGLRHGAYVLRMHNRTDRAMIKSVTAGGQDFTHRPIDPSELPPGAKVVVTMTDELPEIAGVLRATEAATSRAAVMAFPVERDQWRRYGFTPTRIKSMLIDPDGSFRLRGIPAGEYFVVAVNASQVDAWNDPAFLEKAAAVATRVTIGWGETRQVSPPVARIR